MKVAPYERGLEFSRRFKEWWSHIPEPSYDSSLRAPEDHSLPIIVGSIAVLMTIITVGEAMQRAGVF